MPFMMTHAIHGSITALITPFKDGALDAKAYQNLVEWQIGQGTQGLVPCGTTGESPTLTDDEHLRVFELCIEAANGRVPVIAGCGSNDTAYGIHLTQKAQSMGATAALHVTPYYNKPTQEGLYQHFKAIHDATNIPIILYNIPGRSVVNIALETEARLAQLPRIIGMKDATGDIVRPARTRAACGADYLQLAGDDANTLPFLAQGGQGTISVASNIVPKLCAQIHAAWNAGDIKTSQIISDRLMPLYDALFCETSPGPVKYAASLLGLCAYELRLPMVPIAKSSERAVEDALTKLGLYKS
jgi:4-hydroxy-tetrahydrodipicolinate synthase